MKIVITIFVLCLIVSSSSHADDNIESLDELVNVRLLSNVNEVEIGDYFWIAVEFKIKDEWHIYWRNPGDSGIPTKVSWFVPNGINMGGLVEWQNPKRILFDGMANYGYEGITYLFQRFKATSELKLEEVEIKAELSWLVCKEKCIPQNKTVSLNLLVGNTTVINQKNKMIFEKEYLETPEYKSPIEFEAIIDGRNIIISTDTSSFTKNYDMLEVFPINRDLVKNGELPEKYIKDGKLIIKFIIDEYFEGDPSYLILRFYNPLWVTENKKNSFKSTIYINNHEEK